MGLIKPENAHKTSLGRALLNLGAGDHGTSEIRRIRTTNFIAVAAVVLSSAYTFAFAAFGWQQLTVLNSFFVCWYSSILLWNRQGYVRMSALLMLFGGQVHLSVIPLGFVGPEAGIQFFLLVIPVFTFATVHAMHRIWAGLLIALSLASMIFIELQRTGWQPYWPTPTDDQVLAALSAATLAATTGLWLVVLAMVQKDLWTARSSIKTANQKLADNVDQERELNQQLDRESRGRIESQQYFLEHLARVAGLSRLAELCDQQASEAALIRYSSQMAGRISGADQVELLLVDAGSPGLRRLVLHGPHEERSLHGRDGEQPGQWVPAEALPWLEDLVEEGKLVVHDSDVEAGDWADMLCLAGFSSGIAMPVLAGVTTIGVLSAGTRFKAHFDRPTQDIFRGFASTIGSNLGLFRAMQALETNLDQADSVLTSVLPVSVTSRLKGGESNIADRIPVAGVFFCDLAGFTAYSARTEPEAVVAMLQEIFGILEEACAKHQVEKIKTIGDAFMAVSGVSTKVADPIEAIASFALEAAALLRSHLAQDGLDLDFRVGIHAGSVLAGILGSDRLFFDIWGDTVNLASRLESAAALGEINCSDSIRDGLGEGWSFADRGVLELKGKGQQQVWALLGRASAAASTEAGE